MQPLMDLDFLSQADILRLRTEAAGRTPQLLAAEYRPSDAVFGQIEGGLPWWGILGAHYYGQGEQSIEGPSEQSLSILNPYLLVVPELYMRWDAAAVAEVERFGQDAAFYCIPSDLSWFPTVPRATASYDAACLQRNGVSAFSLIAYNARDLNLNYIFVSYEASRNVTKSNPLGAAYRNPQYLHRGGGCGYPGGCNNISPQTPDIDNIQIAGWPVEVVIWFWRDEPGSVDQPPDIVFVLVFD